MSVSGRSSSSKSLTTSTSLSLAPAGMPTRPGNTSCIRALHSQSSWSQILRLALPPPTMRWMILVVEGREARAVVVGLEGEGLEAAGEGRGRLEDDKVVYVRREGVETDSEMVEFGGEEDEVVGLCGQGGGLCSRWHGRGYIFWEGVPLGSAW
jgi:hypothetical protein